MQKATSYSYATYSTLVVCIRNVPFILNHKNLSNSTNTPLVEINKTINEPLNFICYKPSNLSAISKSKFFIVAVCFVTVSIIFLTNLTAKKNVKCIKYQVTCFSLFRNL